MPSPTDIHAYLKRKKSTGQYVSSREMGEAYKGYHAARADRSIQMGLLGVRKEEAASMADYRTGMLNLEKSREGRMSKEAEDARKAAEFKGALDIAETGLNIYESGVVGDAWDALSDFDWGDTDNYDWAETDDYWADTDYDWGDSGDYWAD